MRFQWNKLNALSAAGVLAIAGALGVSAVSLSPNATAFFIAHIFDGPDTPSADFYWSACRDMGKTLVWAAGAQSPRLVVESLDDIANLCDARTISQG